MRGVNAFAGAFSPSDVTGLAGWYDFSNAALLWQTSARAANVAADGDPIGAADDKTANAFHLLQATAGKRFTYKVNIQNGQSIGRGTIAGSSQLFNTAKNYGSQPLTVFAVLKMAAADGTVQFDGGSAGHRNAMGVGIGTAGKLGMFSGTSVIEAVNTPGAFHVYEITFAGASSEILIDGVSLVTGNPGTNAMDDGFRLDGDITPASFSDMDAGEVLIYAANVSAGNRTLIRAFLKSKWGTP